MARSFKVNNGGNNNKYKKSLTKRRRRNTNGCHKDIKTDHNPGYAYFNGLHDGILEKQDVESLSITDVFNLKNHLVRKYRVRNLSK